MDAVALRAKTPKIAVAVTRRPLQKRLQDVAVAKSKTYESEYSVPRVNPISVEGAEDVYGAEGTSDPAVGGIPVADLQGWPMNRDYYQTHSGYVHPTETYYDSYNDFLPEYRFPYPWSPSYSPRDVYRGPDYTIQQTAPSGRLV